MREEYMFCPKCGNVEFATFDDRRYACSRCGYTYFSNTAAATSAVIWHRGRIALITRAREPGEGMLDLPGGFVDSDESIEEAVVREAREEIGIILPAPRFLFSIPNRYCYHTINYSTVDIFFECEIDQPPEFVPNEEASKLCWLAPEEIDLDRLAFHSVRVAVERLRDRKAPESAAGARS